MERIMKLGKTAGVAGMILLSLPVLVPCVLALTFAGALLAVPVGSAAVSYLALKKLINAPKHNPENEVDGGSGELPSSYNVSAEEAPEQPSSTPEPSKNSEEYIVVEKPEGEASPEDMGQCKAAPDYFECVDNDGGVVCEEKYVEEEKGKPSDAFVKLPEGDKPGETFVEVTKDAEKADGEGDEGKKQSEDSARLEKLPEQPLEHVKKEEPAPPAPHENGSELKEEARSSGEYVSMNEDFPSSDESVASSKTGQAQGTKDGISDKEKRTRLRKEIVSVRRIVGCMDATGGSFCEQVERLYSFVGVELPSGYQRTGDFGKLMEAVNLLKTVVGVK